MGKGHHCGLAGKVDAHSQKPILAPAQIPVAELPVQLLCAWKAVEIDSRDMSAWAAPVAMWETPKKLRLPGFGLALP